MFNARCFFGPSDRNELYHIPKLSKIWGLGDWNFVWKDPFKVVTEPVPSHCEIFTGVLQEWRFVERFKCNFWEFGNAANYPYLYFEDLEQPPVTKSDHSYPRAVLCRYKSHQLFWVWSTFQLGGVETLTTLAQEGNDGYKDRNSFDNTWLGFLIEYLPS